MKNNIKIFNNQYKALGEDQQELLRVNPSSTFPNQSKKEIVMTDIDWSKVPGVQQAQDGTKKEKSKYFIRIGVTKKFLVPSTDTQVEGFISLPQVLYLDGMKPNNVNGDSEYAAQLACGNTLLEQLLKKAEELEPGGELVTQLQVKIVRRKEEVAQTADIDFSDIF